MPNRAQVIISHPPRLSPGGFVRDDIDFDLESFDFDRLVYEAVSQIPRGMVSTYGDVARAMGDVKASREVGITLSRNPRPIVVPCHRIVAQDASLGGFSCGLPMKRKLLALEGTLSMLRSR